MTAPSTAHLKVNSLVERHTIFLVLVGHNQLEVDWAFPSTVLVALGTSIGTTSCDTVGAVNENANLVAIDIVRSCDN